MFFRLAESRFWSVLAWPSARVASCFEHWSGSELGFLLPAKSPAASIDHLPIVCCMGLPTFLPIPAWFHRSLLADLPKQSPRNNASSCALAGCDNIDYQTRFHPWASFWSLWPQFLRKSLELRLRQLFHRAQPCRRRHLTYPRQTRVFSCLIKFCRLSGVSSKLCVKLWSYLVLLETFLI